jgi:hypothetical protein
MTLKHEDIFLDDRTHYAYGDDWARVFRVFPENLFQVPVTPRPQSWHPNCAPQEDDEDDLSIQQHRQRCRASLPSTAQEQAAGLNGANDEDDVFRDVVSEYHKAVIKSYLFLVDEESLRKSLFMLVLSNDFGRVVRRRRIPPSECNWISGSWFLRSFFDLGHLPSWWNLWSTFC